MIHFSWDASLLKDVANDPPYQLTASGITAVSGVSECKDQSCVATGSNAYLQLPATNFGQYAGLTFALWFKAKAESGAGSTLLDFGNGASGDGIKVARGGETDQVSFTVRFTTAAQTRTSSVSGVWQANVWRHLVWTLAPTETGTGATWKIYVDGGLAATVTDGAYPSDASYTQNYVGKGSGAGDGAFVGYMDSLIIFPGALSEDFVRFVLQVCSRQHACKV